VRGNSGKGNKECVQGGTEGNKASVAQRVSDAFGVRVKTYFFKTGGKVTEGETRREQRILHTTSGKGEPRGATR